MTGATWVFLRAAATCAIVAACAVPASAWTLIHAGRLIDGRADSVRTSVTVTVDAGRIVSVTDGFAAPLPGDTVIDLKAATVMPGLRRHV